VETGIRHGEKLDEMLISPHDASQSYCYDDNYFVTVPTGKSLDHLEKFPHPEFSSKTKLMSYDEIEEMLRKGDFI
jgi:FlaA1/EpsC-like NDP-sugar epimerase